MIPFDDDSQFAESVEPIAAKLDRWREEIGNELEAMNFFDAMGRHFCIEPCMSTHRQMVLENAKYRPVLQAMLDILEGPSGTPDPTFRRKQ